MKMTQFSSGGDCNDPSDLSDSVLAGKMAQRNNAFGEIYIYIYVYYIYIYVYRFVWARWKGRGSGPRNVGQAKMHFPSREKFCLHISNGWNARSSVDCVWE